MAGFTSHRVLLAWMVRKPPHNNRLRNLLHPIELIASIHHVLSNVGIANSAFLSAVNKTSNVRYKPLPRKALFSPFHTDGQSFGHHSVPVDKTSIVPQCRTTSSRNFGVIYLHRSTVFAHWWKKIMMHFCFRKHWRIKTKNDVKSSTHLEWVQQSTAP